MKKILVSVLISCLFLSFTFAKKSIGLSISTLNNPFFVTLEEGAKSQAQKLGVDIVVLDAQDKPSKQLNDIEDLIRKKVSVILINPTDSDAVISAIKAANRKRIPVITVDRNANGGKISAHVASDNVAGGVMAGKFLLSQVGRNAKVIELEGVPGASATRDRGKGFNQAVKGKLKIVAKQTANFNRVEGLSVMENLLQRYKDIAGVFAHNDEMALGAIKALKAAKVRAVVVGFDATDDAVKAVKEGKMAATVAQKPSLMGSLAVQTAVDIIKKKKVKSTIKVELQLVK